MGGGLQKFQVDCMEWGMDCMEWGMDSILFVDGFHTFSRWIPHFFQMDSMGLGMGSMEWDGLHSFLRWNAWNGGLFHKSRLKFIWDEII